MTDPTPTAEEVAAATLAQGRAVGMYDRKVAASTIAALREAGFYVGRLEQVGWVDSNFRDDLDLDGSVNLLADEEQAVGYTDDEAAIPVFVKETDQ